MRPMDFTTALALHKFNANHDERGRFASGPSGGGGGKKDKLPKGAVRTAHGHTLDAYMGMGKHMFKLGDAHLAELKRGGVNPDDVEPFNNTGPNYVVTHTPEGTLISSHDARGKITHKWG
jgi:hypothetical protein